MTFFLLFCFSFSRNNACKNAGFPEPAMVANAWFADSIIWKNSSKLCLERMPPGKKTECVFAFGMLFLENKRENQQTKQGTMFFSEG